MDNSSKRPPSVGGPTRTPSPPPPYVLHPVVASPVASTTLLSPTAPPMPGFSQREYNNQSNTDNSLDEIFRKPQKTLLHSSPAESNELKVVTSQSTGPLNESISGLGQSQTTGMTSVFSVTDTDQGVPVGVPASGPYPTDTFMPRYSHRVVCPYCKVAVATQVDYVAGTFTHLLAFAGCWMCAVTCLCCLICAPYFFDDLKDAIHYCSNCHKVLGYNRRINC